MIGALAAILYHEATLRMKTSSKMVGQKDRQFLGYTNSGLSAPGLEKNRI